MPQLSRTFFSTILQMEGGYQNLPNDTGNYACGQLAGTNRGVSAIAYKEYTGKCPSMTDMQAITDDFAWEFYNWYWNRFRIDEIEDTDTANLVMNNFMGAPKYAAQSVQKAMNQLGGYNLVVDGKMGSKTIAAINDAVRQNKPAAYNAIRAEWLIYLQGTTYASALTNRVNRFFAALSPTQNPASVTASTEFQQARITTSIQGALKGNWSDIGFLLLLIAGLLSFVWMVVWIAGKLQTI